MSKEYNILKHSTRLKQDNLDITERSDGANDSNKCIILFALKCLKKLKQVIEISKKVKKTSFLELQLKMWTKNRVLVLNTQQKFYKTTNLINLIFITGQFPDYLKIAEMTIILENIVIQMRQIAKRFHKIHLGYNIRKILR